MKSADELVPSPDDDEIAPWQLLADIEAAQERARAALECRLVEAGFCEVSIILCGIDEWKFDLFFLGDDSAGIRAFELLEIALDEFDLILNEKFYEVDVARDWAHARFLCAHNPVIGPVA